MRNSTPQKNYFDKVADYVNDLQSNASSAGTFGAIAIWYDTYARKIDQLPVAGIDPELVEYAQRTANLMYQASSQIRNANYQKSVRQTNVQPQYVTNTWGVTYGYSYGWDGYGGPVGSYGSYTTRDYGAENDEKTSHPQPGNVHRRHCRRPKSCRKSRRKPTPRGSGCR